MSKNDNNPFNNVDLGDMMKMWSENPFVKSLMENEFVQKMSKGEAPDVDMNAIMESQKKNLEALKSMNEKAAEGLGKLAEQQSKMMSDAMEGLKGFKPEEAAESKFEEAQDVFKRAVESMTSIGEVVKNSSEDVMGVVSERMKDSMSELETLIEKIRK